MNQRLIQNFGLRAIAANTFVDPSPSVKAAGLYTAVRLHVDGASQQDDPRAEAPRPSKT